MQKNGNTDISLYFGMD